MQIHKRIAISLIILATLCAAVFAHAGLSQLSPSGYVNDFAGIMNPAEKTKLEQLLTAYDRQTANELSVVTVNSLDGLPIEDYAVRLFEKWGIGKSDKDNGLLLLIAPNEKKARIEVGYGLEGAINDAMAGKILDNTVIPWFRKGDFSTGIINGVVESIRIINERENISFNPSAAANISTAGFREIKSGKGSIVGKIFKVLFLIFIIFIFIKNPFAGLILLSGMSGRGGGFRGGSFGGGGFSGFGGGLSGGGGASRGW